jgi:hypothetical protein
MYIPKYWARAGVIKNGRTCNMASGWSDNSREEARVMAQKKAERIVFALSTSTELARYEYGVRSPLREEIIELFGDDGTPEQVIVTRNRYGSLVLNSASVMFVDIDDPEPKTSMSGFFNRILGRKTEELPDLGLKTRIDKILTTIESRGNPHCVLYRTKAGLRLLVTGRPYDPASDETREFLEACGSDPLYTHLTLNQKCFRARLSPKPWRCHSNRPPFLFPRETGEQQEAFLLWEEKYTTAACKFSVCEQVGEIGGASETAEGVFVRKMHDSYCISAGKPLA